VEKNILISFYSEKAIIDRLKISGKFEKKVCGKAGKFQGIRKSEFVATLFRFNTLFSPEVTSTLSLKIVMLG